MNLKFGTINLEKCTCDVLELNSETDVQN